MNVRTWKVHKIYKGSGRKVILQKRLTEAEATAIVNSYPDNDKTMVAKTNTKK